MRDPEGYEVKNLLLAGQLAGKKVLEIGCGTGWLTWQYASAANRIVGIDPGLPDLQEAKADQPAGVTNVSWTQTMGEALPFPAGTFDGVIFSNSL